MVFPVPETIRQFSEIFNNNGHSLYIVGGAVRDWILGVPNSDYDFCTDATPQQVTALFKHVIPTGIKHGTVTVLFKEGSFEVTTFRTESGYTDKRHPDEVSFVTSLDEDLSRRDFTVNAFAADCRDGRIIDLFGGMADLETKTIRAIGNPTDRFKEDALRLLRMCRFCAKLGFTPNKETFDAACSLAPSISYVSEERIFDETNKLLSSSKPSTGLVMMYETGLMKYIFPELEKCAHVEQNKVGSNNVLTHIFNAVDEAAARNYNNTVRWALLLHDIAKPVCMQKVGGFTRFYGHDVKGSQMANEVLHRLKCSNNLIDTVTLLIRYHMVRYTPNWTDGAVKRFINSVGLDNITSLFELQYCDQVASEGRSKEDEYAPLIKRIENLKVQPLTVKDLAVTGDDLAKAGIPRSKEMGKILNELLEMVIDYPSLNNKETLIQQAVLRRQA